MENGEQKLKLTGRSAFFGLVALGLVVLIPIYFWDQQSNFDAHLFRGHFELYENHVAPFVAATDTVKGDLEAGFYYYEKGAFPQAIQHFERILETLRPPEKGSLQLYIGISYLAMEEPKKALPYLMAMVQSDHPYFHETGQWYLALACLGCEDRNDAIGMLETIIADPDHAYRASADRLLRKIT